MGSLRRRAGLRRWSRSLPTVAGTIGPLASVRESSPAENHCAHQKSAAAAESVAERILGRFEITEGGRSGKDIVEAVAFRLAGGNSVALGADLGEGVLDGGRVDARELGLPSSLGRLPSLEAFEHWRATVTGFLLKVRLEAFSGAGRKGRKVGAVSPPLSAVNLTPTRESPQRRWASRKPSGLCSSRVSSHRETLARATASGFRSTPYRHSRTTCTLGVAGPSPERPVRAVESRGSGRVRPRALERPARGRLPNP